jgi:hypothetical protein
LRQRWTELLPRQHLRQQRLLRVRCLHGQCGDLSNWRHLLERCLWYLWSEPCPVLHQWKRHDLYRLAYNVLDQLHGRRDLHGLWRCESTLLRRQFLRGRRLLPGFREHRDGNLHGRGKILRWGTWHLLGGSVRYLRWAQWDLLFQQSLYGTGHHVPDFNHARWAIQLRPLWRSHAAMLRW